MKRSYESTMESIKTEDPTANWEISSPKRFRFFALNSPMPESIPIKSVDLTLKKLMDGAQKSASMPPVDSSACRICMERSVESICRTCDRPLCSTCIRQCEQCDRGVCNFCFVIDYSQRWERRTCVNCYDDSKRS